jgi:hypothetical protein
MKTIFIVAILIVCSAAPVTAEDQISLLEMDKVKTYLRLDAAQYKKIILAVEQIKNIHEKDKIIIDALKERIKNGDEPGLFEKMSTKRGRGKRIDSIDELIEKIENLLNTEQKIKYKNIIKPVLKGLEKKEIFEE